MDGKLNALATEIVDALDTYAEFSISATGIHLWARAPGFVYDKKRYYINNQKLGLEVYPAGVTTKFIVTTGNAINDNDINECTDALAQIVEKYMVRPYAKNDEGSEVNVPGSFLSDEAVNQKMFASNQKAKECYEGIDPDGKSKSEGDLALCSHYAFWCGGDIEQMDRLFRQSPRMRDKWDEVHGSDTYGNLTLKKALQLCKTFYKPLGISSAEVDFNDLAGVLADLSPEGK